MSHRKLHPDEVREIYLSLHTYSRIAHLYSVSEATVSRIKARKTGRKHTEGLEPALRPPGRPWDQ